MEAKTVYIPVVDVNKEYLETTHVCYKVGKGESVGVLLKEQKLYCFTADELKLSFKDLCKNYYSNRHDFEGLDEFIESLNLV